jgi:DNA-binding transcriptional LysR family regulator
MASMSTITWGRMRTFLAVADHGSVRAAAGALFVTEPAVSAAISHMERSLGTDLLAREGRGVRLTDSGRIYADYCRTILGLIAEASAAVQSSERGLLRISSVETAGECVLPRLLGSFRERFPDVEVSLSVLPRDELFEALSHHETDLAVAGRPPAGQGLATHAIRANRLVMVGAPGRSVDPMTTTWLLRGPGSGTRVTALGLLAQLDATPPTLTLGTHGAVAAAAREGLGITLVHADAVQHDLERGALVELRIPHTPMNRPWHVVTTGAPTRTTQLFLDHITDADRVGAAAFHLDNRPAG